MICPYCKMEAKLVDSKVIYGKSYGKIYICCNYPKCDAYCGTHKGTDVPLGTMANRELREWRKNAHTCFDPLWKEAQKRGQLNARNSYYSLLAYQLRIDKKDCHIAMFNVEQCQETVKFCSVIRKRDVVVF